MRKILLMGNPNVGKSVVFSRLTGVKVITSNYPGTTVEFTKGTARIKNEDFEVIDVPGVYTLEPESKAEEVAVKMLDETFPDEESKKNNLVINVVDATNLERNLNLTFQLIKKKVPVVVALNFWDETKHKGVVVDIEKLAKRLGVPCVPTCAVTGEGIKELTDCTCRAEQGSLDYEEKERWNEVGKTVAGCQKLVHKNRTFSELLNEFSISPAGGIITAVVFLLSSFYAIRIIGESLIGSVGEPFFESIWAPLMLKLSAFLGEGSIIHDILVGKLTGGGIDYGTSFGLLTTGLYVPLAAVLPYVFAFYLVISILEDSGYLPRLAVLMDQFMHKMGLHGFSVIPFILGLGCNVPGALSTRIMETKRERFITATLMAIAVPCMAQIAMVAGLIGKYGIKGFAGVFGTLFVVWALLGFIMNKTVKGESPELFIEIPPYRIPYAGALLKKVWMRIVWFIKEAVPWVLTGVLIINLLYMSGIINAVSAATRPVVSGIMGLPEEAAGALMIGFLRKDVAVGMLVPLNMSLKQLIIASVVLTMYFPCVATFAVLIKELGLKDMFYSVLIMIASTLAVSGLLNFIL